MLLIYYSTLVIPITRADKEVDVFDDSYQPSNEFDQKNWMACTLEAHQTSILPFQHKLSH